VTLWKCYYHVIWATNQRLPALDERREQVFRNVNAAACRELGVLIHEVGVVEDHLHLALAIPPKLAVADAIHRLKGASSRALKEADEANFEPCPGWQQEYGVLTFGERSLADLSAYVRNQREHHVAGTLLKHFELIDRRDA
jgi:putative transposase